MRIHTNHEVFVASRGAPSPGKVRNLDSPRACGVAELRIRREITRSCRCNIFLGSLVLYN